jgi:hypothetical protein
VKLGIVVCDEDAMRRCAPARDAHPVLLQPAVSEQACTTFARRIRGTIHASSTGVLIDIATFVGLTVLYFAYDAYASRRSLPLARATGATNTERRSRVRPFVARTIQETHKPKIMPSTRNTTRRRVVTDRNGPKRIRAPRLLHG